MTVDDECRGDGDGLKSGRTCRSCEEFCVVDVRKCLVWFACLYTHHNTLACFSIARKAAGAVALCLCTSMAQLIASHLKFRFIKNFAS